MHDLPPLFFPLTKNNDGRPVYPRPSPPVASMRAFATDDVHGAAPKTAPNAPRSADAAALNDVANVAGSSLANDLAAQVKPVVSDAADVAANANHSSHVVANGTANAAANIANNGASSAHVVNGRAGSMSFGSPVPGRPNVPPAQINTPTHLKVVRDFPDFPDGNAPAPTETVRFRRPTDEAVQLLPGRLQVISGDPRHQEIRFVRIPGRPAELILGREPGDTAQHVALNSSTVSRKHARFAFQEGRWHIVNLSQTNPVVVNGEELSAYDSARPLNDGDQVELGEVVLRFRSH